MSRAPGTGNRQEGKNKLSANVIALLAGIFVLTPMFGMAGLIWTIAAAAALFKQVKKQAGETGAQSALRFPQAPQTPGPARPQPPRPAARQAVPKAEKAARPSAEQHDHVQSTCLNRNGRLEQLETLRKAGLYTPEEYRKKKEEILREN